MIISIVAPDLFFYFFSKIVGGILPKCIMQYLDRAWEVKYIFKFSRKLEVMSNNYN